MGNCLNPLAQGHVHPVPKGEEGVGNHGRADEAAFSGLGLGVNLFFKSLIGFSPVQISNSRSL